MPSGSQERRAPPQTARQPRHFPDSRPRCAHRRSADAFPKARPTFQAARRDFPNQDSQSIVLDCESARQAPSAVCPKIVVRNQSLLIVLQSDHGKMVAYQGVILALVVALLKCGTLMVALNNERAR